MKQKGRGEFEIRYNLKLKTDLFFFLNSNK